MNKNKCIGAIVTFGVIAVLFVPLLGGEENAAAAWTSSRPVADLGFLYSPSRNLPRGGC